ncbi:hypothetical protein SGUI_3002 [Serinicoccus hydrothermalis]|uniref:DUF3117 domain-containing protein n=2 Tax=Ornithinimicrobiaceae TaxID=2805590 RepID=A0A1B1NG33_9MICO|nr:hypothetical protein SGUI_3002 [Serinicoccus hydrothermalis]
MPHTRPATGRAHGLLDYAGGARGGIIARRYGSVDTAAGERHWAAPRGRATMAAMKPRTGDGPLEVTKEGRGIVLRMPLEGGGRLVVEMNAEEAGALGQAIQDCVG